MLRYHSPFLAYVGPEKIQIGVGTVLPGEHPNLEFHDHDFTEIVLVCSGTARHIVEQCASPVAAGDVLCIQPGAFHAYAAAETLGICNIIFNRKKLALPLQDGWSMDFFNKIFPREEIPPPEMMAAPLLHLEPGQLKKGVRLYKLLETELNGCLVGSQLGAFTHFLELMLFLARCSPQQKSEQQFRCSIGTALAYMHRHFAEHLTLEKLAQISNMSQRNFSRNFYASVGSSPIAYLMQLRLREAAQKLVTTELTVAEIAAGCGFYDSNFFGKQFRRFYFAAPRSFRLQHRLGKHS